MKKLLVFILVLGIASSANAVLITVDGQTGNEFDIQEITTITVVGEDAESWMGYIIIQEGGSGTLSNPIALGAAGDMGAASPYSEAGWGTGYELTVAMSPGGVPAISAGPQFSFDYTGSVGDTVTILLFLDPDFTIPVASIKLNVIPEPMTVILLGLGSLFLRRRK